MTMWPMRATIGPFSPMHVQTKERAHMLDRRHFLIGAGALLTASFVKRAKAFSRRSGEPLVLSPARKPEETLYVYRQESDYGGGWGGVVGAGEAGGATPAARR